jgi:pimeloyl-ACP methyl ester carboxylesterase
MSAPNATTVDVNGFKARVWSKGSGPKLGFLAGYGGMPNWIPFLDKLAEKRTVIVPSLPGFPGAAGHDVLDNHLDWVLAVRQLLDKAGLTGADLAGSSVGASFAAEMAAIWPESVKKLALIAPFGLYEDKEPPADVWAQRQDQLPALLTNDPANYTTLRQMPAGEDQVEWMIAQNRAQEAAARVFWPLSNTRLEKRLPSIKAQTLLVWGAGDKVIPRSYARKMASLIAAPSDVRVIEGAGHLAEYDKPAEVASAILEWLA